MPTAKEYFYVGVSPRVIALDRRSGAVVWATSLPGASMTQLNVHEDDERVYAGAKGEVWALDRSSGNILWHNPLKGFGMRDVMFTGRSDRRRTSD